MTQIGMNIKPRSRRRVEQRIAALAKPLLWRIVRAVDRVLVTRNRRDFERVPGLAIEDWSI